MALKPLNLLFAGLCGPGKNAGIVLVLLSMITAPAGAQQKSDTGKAGPKADTALLKNKAASLTNSGVRSLKDLASAPLRQAALVTAPLAETGNRLGQGLKNIKKNNLSFDLSLENATRYQPLANNILLSGPVVAGPKMVNNIYIKSHIIAWGIPLNFNLSNDQSNLSGLSEARNSLFKFDFSPARFSETLKSDLQNYYDIRKNAFAGLDLSTYTQKVIKDKLGQAAGSKTSNSVVAAYLNQPGHVTELLAMDEEQIKRKLHAVADAGAKRAEATKEAKVQQLGSSVRDSAESKAEALTRLSKNKRITTYLNDPSGIREMKVMNEEQIARKLSPLAGEAEQEAVRHVAHEVFLARFSGRSVKINDMAGQQLNGRALPALSSIALSPSGQNKEIDSVAASITRLKAQLKSRGIDPGKLLAMEKATNGAPGSEEAGSLLQAKPRNALQSFFTRVKALKIGSFGSSVPGATQPGDVFMEGTHITYNAGNMPITLGYGQLNDLVSSKDNAYQASDYNAPKNLTYISLKINKGGFGNSRLSIIGSSSAGTNAYSNNAVPASPSSNVALTISQFLNAGELGRFTLEVSKSTTLFYRNETIGADELLDKKAGLNYSGNDLTEALAFGFKHELNVKAEGLSESSYFSYSGTGYQNPGNNGYGGGGMKLGGNIRKTLFKNKVSLSARADVNHKPISYTSGDEWKTYQVQLDSRYAITKKINISFKYLNGGTDKRVDNINTPVYASQKYQLDGNATWKIGKNYTISHLTIGKQDYANTYLATAGNSGLLMVNYTQSILLHSNTLTGTVFYNRELSGPALIGNMLNSDLTYQYTLLQKLNLATAVTYLDNDAGHARQTGIRQTIQLLAGSHFDVDTFIDLRKNLVTPLYPDLYATCRAELSLKYHLKN